MIKGSLVQSKRNSKNEASSQHQSETTRSDGRECAQGFQKICSTTQI